jgi:4-hydroxy-tetrahydrodipicolinate reductase
MGIRIIVAGAAGRMGREIISAAGEEPDLTIVGGLLRPGALATTGEWQSVAGLPVPGAVLDGDASTLLAGIDAVIDFTTPSGATAAAAACVEAGVPLVSGTTGLTAADQESLRQATRWIPVFYARNMSLGIATLLSLLPAIAATLEGFDVEIVETHHHHKADAPSGTALALAEAIAGGRDGSLDQLASYGRRGIAPRHPGEIGIHAVRAGGNPGEHQVIIASEGEEIRLSHRSFSRRAYAQGALRAARFIVGRDPGFYGLDDVLRAQVGNGALTPTSV